MLVALPPAFETMTSNADPLSDIAVGVRTYSYELAGVDGEGSANAGRAAAAAGVFGLAGGSVLLRRRFL